jgi:hypothetical protein
MALKKDGGVVSARFVAASSGALRKAALLPKVVSTSSQASRKAPLPARKQHISRRPEHKMKKNKISRGSNKKNGGVVSAGFVTASSGALRKAALLPKAASTSSQASRKAPPPAAKQHISREQLQAQHLPAVSILQSRSIEQRNQVSEGGVNELHSLGLSFAGFGKCRQNVCDKINDEQFSANYDVSASTLHAVLADLAVKTPSIKTKDFLMADNELKLYLTEHVQAGRWDMD